METLIALLVVASVAFLMIGMHNPATVLFWDQKARRIKVILYWISSMIILTITASFFCPNNHYFISTEEKIEVAREHIANLETQEALSILKDIDESDSMFFEVKRLIIMADSVNSLTQAEL